MKFPKAVIFDLDACIWIPEMYQLNGGSPFTYDGNYCYDRRGEKVQLLGHVYEFLKNKLQNQDYKQIQLAIASKCDHPDWARECLNLFIIEGKPMIQLFKSVQIYYGSKQNHLRQIQKELQINFQEMIFFDDMMENINDVSKLNVLSIHTPNGFFLDNWNKALELYNKN